MAGAFLTNDNEKDMYLPHSPCKIRYDLVMHEGEIIVHDLYYYYYGGFYLWILEAFLDTWYLSRLMI